MLTSLFDATSTMLYDAFSVAILLGTSSFSHFIRGKPMCYGQSRGLYCLAYWDVFRVHKVPTDPGVLEMAEMLGIPPNHSF